ncbi:hypothetical protein B0H19DRAFT_1371486 [Mycena capillaripes]|nr:hypothetical protein B0H19DRAFT_1371486 [Mycena capillaripes]
MPPRTLAPTSASSRNYSLYTTGSTFCIPQDASRPFLHRTRRVHCVLPRHAVVSHRRRCLLVHFKRTRPSTTPTNRRAPLDASSRHHQRAQPFAIAYAALAASPRNTGIFTSCWRPAHSPSHTTHFSPAHSLLQPSVPAHPLDPRRAPRLRRTLRFAKSRFQIRIIGPYSCAAAACFEARSCSAPHCIRPADVMSSRRRTRTSEVHGVHFNEWLTLRKIYYVVDECISQEQMVSSSILTAPAQSPILSRIFQDYPALWVSQSLNKFSTAHEYCGTNLDLQAFLRAGKPRKTHRKHSSKQMCSADNP